MTDFSKTVYHPKVWNLVPPGPVILTRILTTTESRNWFALDEPARHKFRAEIIAEMIERSHHYSVNQFQIRDPNRTLMSVEVTTHRDMLRSIDE